MNFHKLGVVDVQKTTRNAVVLTLAADQADDFSFTQGQYLTFRKTFAGEELRRCYSICSPRHSGLLQVGIKQVKGGTFSTWANTQLKVGDSIEAMPPMGSFYQASALTGTHSLLFAAGSGITPILSILSTGLNDDPAACFTLVYGNSNPTTIMFRDALEDLKNRYIGRLNVLHLLTDASQDVDLFRGRIDEKKCADLFKHWIDIAHIDRAYLCGPEPMMRAAKTSLLDHAMPEKNINLELFTSAQPGRAKQAAVVNDAATSGIPAQVTLGGESRSFTILREQSLLDAALSNNVDAPHACRAGVCSTCKAKVLDGTVEMLANHALQDDEVNAGFVLTCQCYPTSDTVVWDYDQAGH